MKPTPIVQANKHWLVRADEILLNTRDILATYTRTGIQNHECGLAKAS